MSGGRGPAVPSVGRVPVVGVEHAPPEPPEAPLGREPLEEAVDGLRQLIVEQGHRLVDLGERPADLGAEVPPVREADGPGTEHEPTVALDHQHEIFGHETGRRVEGVQRRVQVRAGVPIREATTQVVDQRVRHLSGLVLDAVERGEHRRRVLGVQA